jgi:hypothetical protein
METSVNKHKNFDFLLHSKNQKIWHIFSGLYTAHLPQLTHFAYLDYLPGKSTDLTSAGTYTIVENGLFLNKIQSIIRLFKLLAWFSLYWIKLLFLWNIN